MSGLIKFHCNKASEEELKKHLLQCDSEYVPPLSDRVDIASYAHKISVNTVRFEAWSDPGLVGLVAVYCNNIVEHAAYITNVSVVQQWQCHRIASSLIDQCLWYVQS